MIHQRIDADKENAGLTNFKGSKPTKQEAEIAKNYLNKKELEILNRMVSGYLEVAKIQALNRNPMYVKDWIDKVDEFVKMTGRDILKDAGKISHQQALTKAESEYEKYKERTKNELSEVEKHFIKQLEGVTKKLGKKRVTKTAGSKKSD